MAIKRPPSAERIAISFCREAARASNRLATFAQAISSTRLTAPIIVKTTSLMLSGTMSSRSDARCSWRSVRLSIDQSSRLAGVVV